MKEILDLADKLQKECHLYVKFLNLLTHSNVHN